MIFLLLKKFFYRTIYFYRYIYVGDKAKVWVVHELAKSPGQSPMNIVFWALADQYLKWVFTDVW